MDDDDPAVVADEAARKAIREAVVYEEALAELDAAMKRYGVTVDDLARPLRATMRKRGR